MRLLPVIAVTTIGVLAIGGVAYAASRDDEEPPLPVPDKDKCSTSQDVGLATSELLADQTISASGFRKAADVLRNWTTFCDDGAKQTGLLAAQLLEARANVLEGAGPVYTGPGPAPTGQTGLWPVPPGYLGSHHTEGLHGEMGTVYWYPNKDEWFYPDNPLLVPYYVPGGSLDIKTSGACECADCECEE